MSGNTMSVLVKSLIAGSVLAVSPVTVTLRVSSVPQVLSSPLGQSSPQLPHLSGRSFPLESASVTHQPLEFEALHYQNVDKRSVDTVLIILTTAHLS